MGISGILNKMIKGMAWGAGIMGVTSFLGLMLEPSPLNVIFGLITGLVSAPLFLLPVFEQGGLYGGPVIIAAVTAWNVVVGGIIGAVIGALRK